jgi:hypothetical protein
MATTPYRPERLQLMLSGEELAALDEWRFANRMPSRSAAVRELLRRGLSATGGAAPQGRRSKSYGVLSGPPGSAGGRGRSRGG